MMRSELKRTMAVLLLAVVSGQASAHEGQHVFSSLMLDRLEVRDSQATGNSSYWEGQGWLGTELDKLWFKTQGDVRRGRAQTAEAQLLYSRAIAPFWDVQLGVRHDLALNGASSRDYGAVAIKGLAPYKFDVDASLYLGNGGAARVKAGYTLLFTQRLSLLPEMEANWYGTGDAARGRGAGLSNVDVGLRLRYEVTREFAPYVGVSWGYKYGNTATLARRNGEPASDLLYTAGVRLWW